MPLLSTFCGHYTFQDFQADSAEIPDSTPLSHSRADAAGACVRLFVSAPFAPCSPAFPAFSSPEASCPPLLCRRAVFRRRLLPHLCGSGHIAGASFVCGGAGTCGVVTRSCKGWRCWGRSGTQHRGPSISAAHPSPPLSLLPPTSLCPPSSLPLLHAFFPHPRSLQTTNKIFNDELFDRLDPHTVLSWQRVRAAHWLADDGQVGRVGCRMAV